MKIFITFEDAPFAASSLSGSPSLSKHPQGNPHALPFPPQFSTSSSTFVLLGLSEPAHIFLLRQFSTMGR
jgi:hypothetical protein